MTKYTRLYVMVHVTIIVALLSSFASADSIWQNTGVGVMAGDWFDLNNWLPVQVPDPNDDAVINNGAEAKADVLTAPGNIDINRFDVGRYATGECEQL